MSEIQDLQKNFCKIREVDQRSKIKNQIMAYHWTFTKNPLKLEKILRGIHN